MKTFKLLWLALLSAFLIAACSNDQNPSLTGSDYAESADGSKIYYEVSGEGETALVFVHGWSCDVSYWENQTEYFAQNYKVVKVDLGGHGKSDTTRADYTIEKFGEDVAAVVNKLELDNVILLGHSMGGRVIIAASEELPGKVKALIGVDTFQDFNMKYDSAQIAGLVTSMKNDFPKTTDWFVRSMFVKDSDSMFVSGIASDMAAANPKVAISALENMFAYDGRDALAKLEIPVYAVNADLWPTNVEGNKTAVKKFEAKILPGTGHFLMSEKPEEFNALLDETIKEALKG